MSDLNSNKKSFNLPTYINIPFFLYQDNRLDRPAVLIAAFFYSLHTAGQKLIASTDYLCELATIKKRQLYNIMNQLEEYQYIKRTGFTNRKKLQWVYCPKSTITVTEEDTSALQCTSDENLDTSAMQCTKLVHSSALNYCTPVHTDIKEDTKDYKTTTVGKPTSTSSFSDKQKKELLDLKLPDDDRADDDFLDNCSSHVEKQINDLSKFQRYTGLRNLLIKLFDAKEHFYAKGFNKKSFMQEVEIRTPSAQDFQDYKNCEKKADWVGAWIQKQKNGLNNANNGRVQTDIKQSRI